MLKPLHFTTVLLASGLCVLGSDEPTRRGQRELSELQSYVGDWRGVGQVRRGSSDGAWTQSCRWQWSFDDAGAALVFESPRGKHFKKGVLRSLGKDGGLEWNVDAAIDGASYRYRGSIDDSKRLVLELQSGDSRPDAERSGAPDRITIRQVADGDRMLVLYERRNAAGGYSRISEIGYTRKGSGFGNARAQVECVVTGGLGTIPVTHQGKQYHVCCSGCLDYFKENPDAVLAEYAKRKEEERERKP